ncbi:exonuclease RecJ [Natranaerovirga pectinivora]|uniref:Single-stranded-DNA-specific exonuclease RecJ n=1 Tax=Natranaerovirga pectinivora TaxID=682400 RepID=A0A4R3MSU7_9FIRM|nr:single-stranded-DNA-specific exonuclease RecJ [Natranaerovirga pectinivora]TCT16780.1 exonuclease RecJ [Natranaerovirga pectinivora]
MVPKKTIWEFKQTDSPIEKIMQFAKVPKPIATILANRGIDDKDKLNLFLNPSKEQFHNPFLLKDMDKAVNRILQGIDLNEKICIYGDYDVDGITSTSTLYLFLKKELGANVIYYIPNRLEEGYGINTGALKAIKEMGVDLVITVDTGITAIGECSYGREIGLDMIITDHHECQEGIPEAIAVVNPKRKDCNYPFKMLAGVGVVFKLIHALSIEASNISMDTIWKYLDIVAIGTVADIVPLVDENRIITFNAFKTIPSTWNIGLKSLLAISEYKPENKMTAGFIGFRLAPRLNAGGRIGDAKRGVELFITEDYNHALEIAEELNKENRLRQELEEKIFNEAVKIIEEEHDVENEKILVVASSHWHHGVIGIVSSRITEKYYRPSIILCIEEGIASGSARSVEGFSIFDALSSTKHLMNKFGGHDMAAGMSLDEDKIPLLRQNLNEYALKEMTEDTLIPKLKADMAIGIEEVTLSLVEKIEALEPYGLGNPEPLFVVKGVTHTIKAIGKDSTHLRIDVKEKDKRINGIGFNMANFCDYFEEGSHLEILCALSINEWNGLKSSQMMIKDIRHPEKLVMGLKNNISDYNKTKKTGDNELKDLLIKYGLINVSRGEFELIYKKLNYFYKIDKKSITIFNLINKYEDDEFIKVLIVLDVFIELGIVTLKLDLPYITFDLIKNKKVELENSILYNLIREA